ncbi:GNAT family N-acetyltransferase [Nitrosomonas communis]|uniref:GNAT family N-acetyltransferase n=1 Tax=Nitrosomonas communis TaxID=44574 RepID=UPI0015A6B429|nr:GNAT family N-acetyltransferase [Nitrosomonas communis]
MPPPKDQRYSATSGLKPDTTQIADIELDPCTRLYIGQTITTKEEFIEVNCPVGYAIEAIPENIIIGSIDMYPFKQDSRKLELRILLRNDFRRKGIASKTVQFFVRYIFSLEKAKGAVAVIHPYNSNSIKLFTKLGFEYTDKITDERHIYELSRPGFDSLKGSCLLLTNYQLS